MHTYNQIKSLSLEVSSNCQAKCPMCTRNYHGGLENPILPINNITIEFFKSICPQEFIQQLNDIVMCGNFGDPIMNNDLLHIVEHITKTNPRIKIGIDTNGSARTISWWEDLAKVLPRNHEVRFGIDGLEDTHYIHRINTDFQKILDNATAFISAGGNASWCFLEFKHNEHQVTEAEELSKTLGFRNFYRIQSSRFIGKSDFEVLDKNGNLSYVIEQSSQQNIPFIDPKMIADYKKILSSVTITCESERSKIIHIDAQGYLWPCSFTAGIPYIFSKPEDITYNYITDAKQSLKLFLDRNFGGMKFLNLRNNSIQEIVNSTHWQTAWNDAFKSNCLSVCARVCGNFKSDVNKTRNHFTDLKDDRN